MMGLGAEYVFNIDQLKLETDLLMRLISIVAGVANFVVVASFVAVASFVVVVAGS